MRILAIETSCDETAFALVEAQGGKTKPRFVIKKNQITSQIPIHRKWGGVVPNLAKREHIKNLPKIFQSLKLSKNLKEVDVIAVTVGPGLSPALWQGIEFAQKIGAEYGKSVVGVNHLEGHVYSILLPGKKNKESLRLPAVGMSVSGGHTNIVLLKNLLTAKKLGETRDDAAGEAFDKVGKMLGLPYPGGPEIEKLAKTGNPKAIRFPRPMILDENYEFSFSGLKTSVLYLLRDHKAAGKRITKKYKSDICASFQQAVIDVLISKTLRAAKQYKAKSLFLCGGVSANKAIQKAFAAAAKEMGVGFIVPASKFNTDNAAMIAAAAYINSFQNKKHPLNADPNLSLPAL